MCSICSVNLVKNVSQKFLVCLGFGIDSFHDVSHHTTLENIATLTRSGHYLGCLSLTNQMQEAQLLTKCFQACQPFNSIVTSSIVSAVEGQFGNYHSPHTAPRTRGSELYISPLMSIFWCFDLEGVAQNVLYLKKIENTTSAGEIRAIIHQFCSQFYENSKYIGPRKNTKIPY